MRTGRNQEQSPFGELVGTTILSADGETGTVEVAYEAKPEFTNRIGTVSGGMLCAMLDSVTGLAALEVMPENLVPVHTSISIHYLRPVQPGPLTAYGRVLEHADRDVRSEGELLDEEGTVVARGEATLRVIRKKGN